MTTNTTPEQIREAAIERVARALYETSTDDVDTLPRWDAVAGHPKPLSEDERDVWRNAARPIVDALADMLPTAVRYAVARTRDELTTPRCVGEPLPHCDELAAEHDTVVIRQYLGEWVPNA